MIHLIPDRITAFKNYECHQREFCCLASRDLFDKIYLVPSAQYLNAKVVKFDVNTVEELFSKENTDYLILLNSTVKPRYNNRLMFDKNLKPSSRIIEIPLFSTAPSLQDIELYLESLYITKPQEFDQKVDHFFKQLELSRKINFYNPEHEVSLHYQCALLPKQEKWLEIGGYSELGKKQVYPCGEIEVSPLPFDNSIALENQSTLDVSGEVIITGPCIVNAGYFPFIRRSQEFIYQQLSGLSMQRPIKLKVRQGKIIALAALDGKVHESLNFLDSLLSIEARYSLISEIGISFNDKLRYIPGNQFYNELVDTSAYGSGTLHLGLGLLTSTQYHFDIFACNTRVQFE